MRTYGRVLNGLGKPTWVEVSTDINGHDDYVWLTTLIQVLKLNLGESPFYSNYGIPAQQSVLQQVFPDFYVAVTQSQFAQYFSSLIIAKVPGQRNPTYRVNVVTNAGVKTEQVTTTIFLSDNFGNILVDNRGNQIAAYVNTGNAVPT